MATKSELVEFWMIYWLPRVMTQQVSIFACASGPSWSLNFRRSVYDIMTTKTTGICSSLGQEFHDVSCWFISLESSRMEDHVGWPTKVAIEVFVNAIFQTGWQHMATLNIGRFDPNSPSSVPAITRKVFPVRFLGIPEDSDVVAYVRGCKPATSRQEIRTVNLCDEL